MDKIKNVFVNHIEKVVLGLAVVFVLMQGFMMTKARAGQELKSDIVRRLDDLEREVKKSKAPDWLSQKLTYLDRLSNIWKEPPPEGPVDPSIFYPPGDTPPGEWPEWTLKIGKPGRYACKEKVIRIKVMPSDFCPITLSPDGMTINTRGATMEGTTRITVECERDKEFSFVVEVKKDILDLRPPVLLGAYVGEQMSVGIFWQDNPAQSEGINVDTFWIYRTGPLEDEKPRTIRGKVSASGGSIVDARNGKVRGRVLRVDSWTCVGYRGARMSFFDDSVKADATYTYRIGCEANVQGEVKQVTCPTKITVRTPPGVHVFCTGAGAGGGRKAASMHVVKWVRGKWERADFDVRLHTARPRAKIGNIVKKGSRRMDLRTPYTLVDVAKGKKPLRHQGITVRVPAYKAVFDDTDGFRHERYVLSKGELADSVREAVSIAGLKGGREGSGRGPEEELRFTPPEPPRDPRAMPREIRPTPPGPEEMMYRDIRRRKTGAGPSTTVKPRNR